MFRFLCCLILTLVLSPFAGAQGQEATVVAEIRPALLSAPLHRDAAEVASAQDCVAHQVNAADPLACGFLQACVVCPACHLLNLALPASEPGLQPDALLALQQSKRHEITFFSADHAAQFKPPIL